MNSLGIVCVILFCIAAIESARIDKLEKQPRDRRQRRNVEKLLGEIRKGKDKVKDRHRNGLRRGKQKRDKDGNKVTRINQEYDDLPVKGFEIIEHETSGKAVFEISKATGRRTGKKLRPRKKKQHTGKFVLDLEQELGRIEKTRLRPHEALRKLKQKHGRGKNIRNEHAESIIHVDETTGQAQVAYAASFFGESSDGPVYPVVISDTDGNVLVEYDNIQHRVVQSGSGPGGNAKIDCYNYDGSDKPLLKVKDLFTGRCRYDTGSVKVVNLHGAWNNADNTPFEYNCYHQDSDSVNGACSPLNDALHFGNKIYEMYNSWFKQPPLGEDSLYLKVHYGTNYQNAFWDGSAMTFGDGGSVLHPLVSLDVTAHEVAHGVTTRSSNLYYWGQSGGLNEAFSDMAGKAAERYARGYNAASFNWAVGSDIMKSDGQIRCMDNPQCDRSSIDHVSQYYYGMDVHLSSGIFNKVFYRLATKFAYNLWDAFDLFYIANTKFWGPYTNFVDGAELTLKAMDEMKLGMHLPYRYGWINIQDIVEAFAEVGIQCSKSGSTWNCS